MLTSEPSMNAIAEATIVAASTNFLCRASQAAPVTDGSSACARSDVDGASLITSRWGRFTPSQAQLAFHYVSAGRRSVNVLCGFASMRIPANTHDVNHSYRAKPSSSLVLAVFWQREYVLRDCSFVGP